MTVSACIALFFAMIVLAIIPGSGVLIVVSRSLSNGFRAGLLTSLGIVAGDYAYIFLALMGLAALAQHFNEVFLMVRYFGAAYLVWLGARLVFNPLTFRQPVPQQNQQSAHHFIAGFLVTLANPKAILFYVSFLPAFIDLGSLSGFDVLIIYILATVTVGGVMVAYAYLVSHGARFLNARYDRILCYFSGAILVVSGIYLAVRSA